MTLMFVFKVIRWLCNKTQYCTSCVCSTVRIVLNGFVPYLAQMVNSMRGCAIWSWPVFFKIILQWICKKTCWILPILPWPLWNICCSGIILSHMTQMINSMRGCIKRNAFWPCLYLQGHFAMTLQQILLRYYLTCHMHSITSIVLDIFCCYFSYLAQMISSRRGCFECMIASLVGGIFRT